MQSDKLSKAEETERLGLGWGVWGGVCFWVLVCGV